MKRLLILFLLVLITGLMAFAQADLQSVARVTLTRSQPITVGQLRTEMERRAWPNLRNRFRRNPTQAELRTEVQNSTVQQRRGVLEAMIDEALVLQAAERDRVTVTDAELNQRMSQIRMMMAQQIGRQITDEEFATLVMNQTGMGIPAFREVTRRQVTIEKYILNRKQDLFASIREPTEAEILNIYSFSRTQFIRPDTIRFSMIEVPYGPDAASRARARDLANRLSSEIGGNPSRFDEAVQRSQVPNSGYRAGDGGYIPRNMEAFQMLGEEFVNIAFSLRHGEVSRLIEGPEGFLIIRMTESLPQRSLELDDIMIPGVPVTVRQHISQALLEQRLEETTMRATQEVMTELRTGNPFQIIESNLNW